MKQTKYTQGDTKDNKELQYKAQFNCTLPENDKKCINPKSV